MNIIAVYELNKHISVVMKSRKKVAIYIVVSLILFSSCQNGIKNVEQLVREWEGKEIQFPPNSVFTVQGKDTIEYMGNSSSYKIVTYVDSIGCTSCKLQLLSWEEFIHRVDSVSYGKVSFLFYFHPKDKSELRLIFRRDNFEYPVCLDENDCFNKLNHFPSDMMFQTFLLDRDNKVLAIGNPVHNFKVKELYLKIIQGEISGQTKEAEAIMTEVAIDKTSISLGRFNWQKEQKATFTLKNTGNKPLVVQDINTSCGCTSVSYSKEPVQPGGELKLEVTYTAEHPEHFNKTITVYCNTESSPLILKIMGDAE